MGRFDMMVIEERNGKEFALHHVHLPAPRESGFYIQHKSMNAFKQRALKRFGAYQDKHGYYTPMPMHFDVRIMESYNREAEIWRTIGLDPHESLGTISHASPFDFYRYIGFDYKKNRFVTAQGTLSEQHDAANAPVSQNME
jgi:hypothetical protein